MCKGTNLSQLVDVDRRVDSSVLGSMPLFDTASARDCLRNKRLVLLGDSVTTEAFHDLALLLLGLGEPIKHWEGALASAA